MKSLSEQLLEFAKFDESEYRAINNNEPSYSDRTKKDVSFYIDGLVEENARLLPLLQACARVVEAAEFVARACDGDCECTVCRALAALRDSLKRGTGEGVKDE